MQCRVYGEVDISDLEEGIKSGGNRPAIAELVATAAYWESGGAAPCSHQHGLRLAMARDPPALQQGLQGEVQEVPGQTGVQGLTYLRKALIPLKTVTFTSHISKSKHIHTTQSFSSETVVISRIWMKLLSAVFLSYLEQLMLPTFNLRLRMSFLLLLFYLPYYA